MIYVGQHRTENTDDNYMGSGILVARAIQKHGKINFRKDILFDFDTFEEMDAKEAEIVNEEFVQRNDTYNLMPGGNADKGYATRNKKLVNNGQQQKMVAIIDIPTYIDNGWELGSIAQTYSGMDKGKIWIRNITLNEQHMVFPKDAEQYMKIPGWEYGQIPRPHAPLPQLSERWKDYKIICYEDKEKHVPYWEVDAYLLDGWQLGSRKSLAKTLWKYSRYGLKWMCKGNLFSKQVEPSEIDAYLADGWTFGRPFVCQKKQRKLSEQQKEFMRQLWTGSKYMNDGTITKQVLKRDIDLFLALGWKFGSLNNKGRIFVHNNYVCHSIKQDELQTYLDAGFKRGKLHVDHPAFHQYKGGFVVHNIETGENKKLKANQPIPAGYEEGLYSNDEIFEKLSKRTKGNRYIMNDITGEVSHIKQGDPLPEGWHYGRHKRKLTEEQRLNIHKKCSERTWYTNGEKNTMVPWGKEQEYIDAGWKKGRSQLKRRVNKLKNF